MTQDTLTQPEINPAKLYTTDQASEILALHVESIRRMIRQGRIEVVYVSNRWIRIPGRVLIKIVTEGLPKAA